LPAVAQRVVIGLERLDAADAGARLSPAPAEKQYFSALMDYADRADWGKSPLPRWEVTAP